MSLQGATKHMNDRKMDRSRMMRLPQILAYVFIPSVLTTALYIVLSISFHRVLPTILLFFIAATLLLFPLQIVLIMKESKDVYGKYSLRSALDDQRRHPLWFTFLLGMASFGFAGLMTLTLMPWEASLFGSLSSALYQAIPKYFNWGNLDHIRSYSKPVLIVTGVFYLILNGFVGPIVEELFFRGYLTKKLKLNNWLAPFLMTVLFSIYHFWLPFSLIFRIIAFFPAFYWTWKLKDIKVSIVFHCSSNLFATIMLFLTIMSA
jgi:uncharacterized protein